MKDLAEIWYKGCLLGEVQMFYFREDRRCERDTSYNGVNKIQGVPGGMWNTSGECSLC